MFFQKMLLHNTKSDTRKMKEMSKRETNLRIVANFSKCFMVVCLVFQQLVLELLLLEYGL